MDHAARNIPTAPASDVDGHRENGGFAVWIVLYAALMVAMLTLVGSANLLGDHFNASAVTAWNKPA